MSRNRRLIVNVVYLSSPVWGLVLFFGLLSVLPGGANTPGEPIILLGMLAPFVGATPIFRMPDGAIFKTILFLMYYAVCAFTMFFVGWEALMLFRMAAH